MCTLNLREQVTEAASEPYDPQWQSGFTPLKPDKRVNGHRHPPSLYMRCDGHVINYSSKKTTKVRAACWQSADGPVAILPGGRFYASHTCNKVQHGHGEKLDEDVPSLVFHLSAHIKQRYPSPSLPPTPAIPTLHPL